MLKTLCELNGASGNENAVRDYIISQLKVDYVIDNLGSVIVKIGNSKISMNAHMDEVGFIITGITEDGYLRFDTVG